MLQYLFCYCYYFVSGNLLLGFRRHIIQNLNFLLEVLEKIKDILKLGRIFEHMSEDSFHFTAWQLIFWAEVPATSPL